MKRGGSSEAADEISTPVCFSINAPPCSLWGVDGADVLLYRIRNTWRRHGLLGIIYGVWRRVWPDGRPNLSHTKQEILNAAQRVSNIEADFKYKPLISILCPVCDPRLEDIQALVSSVFAQQYPHWEVCFADDASVNHEVIQYLNDISAENPERVRLTTLSSRSHIVAASNAALEMASGEYIALLDHDDLLAPHALSCIVERLQAEEHPEILYSDEVKIDESGEVIEVHEKPSWSPMYFRSFMYTGHLTVYAKTLIDTVGGFQTGFDGSQDYELFLRAARVANNIAHIPEKLYYWRSHSGSVAASLEAKPYAFEAAQRALKKNIEEVTLEFPLQVDSGDYPGITRYVSKHPTPEVISFAASSSREEIAHFLRQSSEQYVCLVRDDCPTPSTSSLRKLLTPLAFPDVFCTLPIITAGWRPKVLAAGYSRTERGMKPNLRNHSTLIGAPGHRLYCCHEVEIAPFYIVCGRRHEMIMALEKTAGKNHDFDIFIPAGMSPIVVPETRFRAPTMIQKEIQSIDTFNGLRFSVLFPFDSECISAEQIASQSFGER